MRQIVLDTETTGLEVSQGHRIIEIGCVELLNRRLTGNNLHLYIHPDRDIDAGAAEVHGITLEQLEGKPRFTEIAEDLYAYFGDADLVIHNAPFDLGFLNAELKRVNKQARLLEKRHTIIDTLVDARQRYPGQRNSLDALCKRLEIDNSSRTLHGALLDAELLADVYLAMTGGQIDIGLVADRGDDSSGVQTTDSVAEQLEKSGRRPGIRQASADELVAHNRYLDMLAESSDGQCVWCEFGG